MVGSASGGMSNETDGNLEYALDYGEKKGFNTFTITEVFAVE